MQVTKWKLYKQKTQKKKSENNEREEKIILMIKSKFLNCLTDFTIFPLSYSSFSLLLSHFYFFIRVLKT